MFVPTQAPKERAEAVRVSFPGSTIAVLQEMAKDAKVDVSEIVRQAVDYALASRLSNAPKHRSRKSAKTADHREPGR